MAKRCASPRHSLRAAARRHDQDCANYSERDGGRSRPTRRSAPTRNSSARRPRRKTAEPGTGPGLDERLALAEAADRWEGARKRSCSVCRTRATSTWCPSTRWRRRGRRRTRSTRGRSPCRGTSAPKPTRTFGYKVEAITVSPTRGLREAASSRCLTSARPADTHLQMATKIALRNCLRGLDMAGRRRRHFHRDGDCDSPTQRAGGIPRRATRQGAKFPRTNSSAVAEHVRVNARTARTRRILFNYLTKDYQTFDAILAGFRGVQARGEKLVGLQPKHLFDKGQTGDSGGSDIFTVNPPPTTRT